MITIIVKIEQDKQGMAQVSIGDISNDDGREENLLADVIYTALTAAKGMITTGKTARQENNDVAVTVERIP